MGMLAPDLLDRRALALLRFVDISGIPVPVPLGIAGDGIRFIAKGGGGYALLEAAGLEAYSGTFDPPPSTPAVGAVPLRLDVNPTAPSLAPRGFTLPLPRDPDPAHADQAGSVFAAMTVELLPGPTALPPPGGCALRVAVTRSDDGRVVENALVRGRSDAGLYLARGLTDARGEACLIFTGLPIAFAKSGGGVQPDTPAHVVVTVDPATALFHAAGEIADAQAAAAARTTGHADPDSFAAVADAAFAAGAAISIAAGARRSLALQWSPA
ncbi:MAG TPA: hypothetical protein VFW19_04580 [Allosphingosinicella sp.]|nr:hypothetical protein [Allosphingosinicella sp.]